METENTNSQNSDEGLLVPENENASEDVESLKSELAKLRENNRHLYARTKKAEGFEQNAEGKWVKIEVNVEKKSEKKSEEKVSKKSDELGYGELAFFISKGGKDEDIDFTKDEFKKFKSTNPDGKFEEFLVNPYFKSSLDSRVAEREGRNATPQGEGRSGQGSHDSFEVHLKRYRETGKLPQGRENAQLRVKLARARLDAEKTHDEGPENPIVGDYRPR